MNRDSHGSVETSQRAVVLDPDIRRFAEAVRAAYAQHAMVADTPVERAREIAEIVRRPWAQGGPAMERSVDRTVPVAGGAVRVRVHTPRGMVDGAVDGAALVYLHGGGWTLFSLDTHDRLMREYASRAGVRVIGIEYSRAPEARFPRAIEECCAVVHWLQAEGPALGVDPARLAIGGDSAGANLSVAACLRLRDRGLAPPLRGMLLNYGAYDGGTFDLADGLVTPPGFTLTYDEMKRFWRNYLRGPADVADPLANLLLADPAGLPPALMVAADCDTLHAENLAMAAKFRAAGVPVDLVVYPGTTHSFLEAVSIARVANRALDESAAWLRGVLRKKKGPE